MVRPLAAKGTKRKKKNEDRYDREEESENEAFEDNAKETAELDGIPIAPSDNSQAKKPGVIFILEKASLEVAQVGKVCAVFQIRVCYC